MTGHAPDLSRLLDGPIYVTLLVKPGEDPDWDRGGSVHFSYPEARATLRSWSARNPVACLEIRGSTVTDVTAAMLDGGA